MARRGTVDFPTVQCAASPGAGPLATRRRYPPIRRCWDPNGGGLAGAPSAWAFRPMLKKKNSEFEFGESFELLWKTREPVTV